MTEYVRVPVEPTEEMIMAGKAAIASADTISEIWEAFIAAAPQDDELARLEREIAEAAARRVYWDCLNCCAEFPDDDNIEWTHRECLQVPESLDKDLAIDRYLELRGLLERHPENPNLVRVKD